MAIDLPPAIPPQLSTAERIEAYAPASTAALEVSVADHRLVITGNRYLSESDIQQIAAVSTTPSQAIRALSRAYYEAGHLLVTVYYAPMGNEVRVHIINAGVADIVAPEAIRVHFTDLIGDDDPTVAEFETSRVLADLKSERTAHDYRISYSVRNGDPESYILKFHQEPVSDADIFDVILQLGNQGNRFLGRYFAGAGLKQRLGNGGELFLAYETAVTEWGEARNGRDYDGFQLQYNHPTRWGLYGVEAEHIAYELEATAVGAADDSAPAIVDLGNTLLCSSGDELCDDSDAPSGLGGLLGSTLLPGDSGTGSGSSGSGGSLLGGGAVESSVVILEADISSLALTGEQVLYSDRRQRLTVSERLEYTDTNLEIMDGATLLEEDFASLEVGARYFRGMHLGSMPVNFTAQVFAETGLSSDDGTLGTDERSHVVSQGRRSAEYLLYRPDLNLRLQPWEKLGISLAFTAQFSDKQLPQQRQWVLGGLSNMSAYLPGILVGDSGSYSQLSVDAGDWQLWGTTLKASLFVEHGQARYEDVSGALDKTQSLTDGGGRLQASWGNGISMELMAASPMADDNVPQDELDRFEVDFYWRLKADW